MAILLHHYAKGHADTTHPTERRLEVDSRHIFIGSAVFRVNALIAQPTEGHFTIVPSFLIIDDDDVVRRASKQETTNLLANMHAIFWLPVRLLHTGKDEDDPAETNIPQPEWHSRLLEASAVAPSVIWRR